MTQTTLIKRKTVKNTKKNYKKNKDILDNIEPKYIYTKDKKTPILQYKKSGYEKILKHLIK